MFTAFIISALMGAPNWLYILLLTFSMNSVAVKVRSLTGEMETAQRGKKLIKKNLGYYVYFFCLSLIVKLCTILVVGAPLLLLLYMHWLDSETVKMGDPSTLSTTYWVLTGLTAFRHHHCRKFINTWEDYAELYILRHDDNPKPYEKAGQSVICCALGSEEKALRLENIVLLDSLE